MFIVWGVFFREKVTRHLYYLQLKENLLHYNHVCSEGKCFQMVSYALQADLGNYSSEKHAEGYFDPREYFPAWVTIFPDDPVILHCYQNLQTLYFQICFNKSNII